MFSLAGGTCGRVVQAGFALLSGTLAGWLETRTAVSSPCALGIFLTHSHQMTQTSNTVPREREQPGSAGLGLEISTEPLPKLFLGQSERRTVSGEENFKGRSCTLLLVGRSVKALWDTVYLCHSINHSLTGIFCFLSSPLECKSHRAGSFVCSVPTV